VFGPAADPLFCFAKKVGKKGDPYEGGPLRGLHAPPAPETGIHCNGNGNGNRSGNGQFKSNGTGRCAGNGNCRCAEEEISLTGRLGQVRTNLL